MSAVTDSPLRRSTRSTRRPPAESSPESIASELSGPATKTRSLRLRKLSTTSDISEIGDDVVGEGKRITRRSSAAMTVCPDTPPKTRLRLIHNKNN